MPRICLIPNVSGTGGMVSFRYKLCAGLKKAGIETCFNLEDEPYQAVLIIGGTRQLAALGRAKRKGVRLVQRLDGINWIQRKRRTGLRHTLRAELGNLLQATIRKRLTGHVIYQSTFARSWWEDWYGILPTPASIIHNGVDLNTYSPMGHSDPPQGCFRLLVVEGSLGGGYESGLENALSLVEELNITYKLPVELMVVGRVAPALQTMWTNRSRVPILWAGNVPRETIPAIDRSAHLLFAADLHPACPNSVIEALACGLPVAGFDTGSLRELVPARAGCITPYGSDPWNLEKPDIPALAEMAAAALMNLSPYQQAARLHAEQNFDLDVMVAKYVHVLLEVVE
jgi:glycosyltransferase involved in cell wall biosynthesis